MCRSMTIFADELDYLAECILSALFDSLWLYMAFILAALIALCLVRALVALRHRAVDWRRQILLGTRGYRMFRVSRFSGKRDIGIKIFP